MYCTNQLDELWAKHTTTTFPSVKCCFHGDRSSFPFNDPPGGFQRDSGEINPKESLNMMLYTKTRPQRGRDASSVKGRIWLAWRPSASKDANGCGCGCLWSLWWGPMGKDKCIRSLLDWLSATVTGEAKLMWTSMLPTQHVCTRHSACCFGLWLDDNVSLTHTWMHYIFEQRATDGFNMSNTIIMEARIWN